MRRQLCAHPATRPQCAPLAVSCHCLRALCGGLWAAGVWSPQQCGSRRPNAHGHRRANRVGGWMGRAHGPQGAVQPTLPWGHAMACASHGRRLACEAAPTSVASAHASHLSVWVLRAAVRHRRVVHAMSMAWRVAGLSDTLPPSRGATDPSRAPHAKAGGERRRRPSAAASHPCWWCRSGHTVVAELRGPLVFRARGLSIALRVFCATAGTPRARMCSVARQWCAGQLSSQRLPNSTTAAASPPPPIRGSAGTARRSGLQQPGAARETHRPRHCATKCGRQHPARWHPHSPLRAAGCMPAPNI